MAVPASRLLQPETLAALGDLQLLARTVVEGFLAGHHHDRRGAAGVEFRHYRAYEPGDDLRRVDWKAYGRSDRYYLRQAEVEREVTVRFVLDASRSMAHREDAVSKFDYARWTVAALAFLADRQGDRLSCCAIGDGGCRLAPPSPRRSLTRLLHFLEGLKPAGRWPPWRQLAPRLGGARRRELIVMVSDLHQDDGEILDAVRALSGRRREVMVLHLLGGSELRFDWRGDLVFADLESGATVRANAAEVRDRYLAAQRAELDEWRRALGDLGASYHRLTLDEPLDGALRALLQRRAGG